MTDQHCSDGFSSCPECGGDLFQAIPDQTTEEEILEFQQEVERRQGISAIDAGWIHPGTYCYDCKYGILVEYVLPIPWEMDERPGVLILETVGADPLKVTLAVKNGLGVTPPMALRLVRSAPVTLLRKSAFDVWRLEKIKQAIVAAGGSARVERLDETSD